jgi:xylulokinase
VRFFPHLAGAGAPHWDAAARGAFTGLSLHHGTAHLVRAVMEGVSCESREILDVFAEHGLPVEEVRLTGGLSHVTSWNQLQADLFARPVRTLEEPDATLLGAAILAAVGCGAFPDVAAATDAMVHCRETFEPRPAESAAHETQYRAYRRRRNTLDDAGAFHPTEEV